MLNPFPKLNQKCSMTTSNKYQYEKVSVRDLFIAGEENKNVVGLCADLTESTQMIYFKNKFPERFVEVGVAEQNLATVASGMAAMERFLS